MIARNFKLPFVILSVVTSVSFSLGQELCPPTNLEAIPGDTQILLEWIPPDTSTLFVVGQGGETFADAVAIPGLPAEASGTTVGYVNDYGPYVDPGDLTCPPVGTVYVSTGAGPDVVYLLSVSTTTTITISLCGNTWDTSIGIFNSDGTIFAIDDDACEGLQSEITCEYPPGDYYVVVSGYGTASGEYVLNIFESTGITSNADHRMVSNEGVDFVSYKLALENGEDVTLEDFGYVGNISGDLGNSSLEIPNSRNECGTLMGFIVYQDADSIDFTVEDSYLVTGLTNDVEYCYEVTALYDEGESAPTDPACATPETLYVASLPISEDFEDSLGEGWGQDLTEGAPTEWSFGTNVAIPPGDGNYAWINDDEVGSGTTPYVATLHTPYFSTADSGIIIVSFEYAWNELGDFFDLVWRLPNAEWELLDSLTESLSWKPVTLDVTDVIGGLDAVQIGFRYDDNASWAWWVGLDNVNIASMTEVSITGNVSSALTGGPLSGAEIKAAEQSYGFQYTALTDTNGDYSIAGLSGIYDMTARAEGHQSAAAEDVDASAGAVVDFVLEPDLPGVAGLTAVDGGNKDIQLDWLEPGSVSEYELFYHDDAYESQLGCGGGCWLGTRMTPPAYPATLVGAFMAFQGDANTTGGTIQVWVDPTGSNDPENNADLVWESEPFAAPPGEYFFEIPDIEIASGDFYLMHNEAETGFSGLAMDESGGYADRMYYANTDGWFLISEAGFPFNYFQTAYMVGVPPGVNESALVEIASSNIRIATPERYKTWLSASDRSIKDKSQILEANTLQNPDFVLTALDQYFTDPETWASYGAAARADRDSTISALEVFRDDSLITTLDSNALSYLDQDTSLEYDVEYCYYIKTQWYVSDYDVTVYGRTSNTACAIPRLLGDVNGDHVVDVLDIVEAVNFILELDTPDELEFLMADVNQDGAINILDIVKMVDIMLGRAVGPGKMVTFDPNVEAILEIVTPTVALHDNATLGITLSYEGVVTGTQFSLRYDSELISLASPSLAVESGATVFARRIADGEMMVMVVDLQGNSLDLGDGGFLTFPIQLVKGEAAGAVSIAFGRVVVAGANGRQVPVVARSASLDLGPIPEVYALHQNFPNPFNPSTSIKFDLKDAGHVRLVIYDLLGREVSTLVNDDMRAGYHEIVWSGSDDLGSPLGAGIYIYSLSTNGFHQTRKMILLK